MGQEGRGEAHDRKRFDNGNHGVYLRMERLEQETYEYDLHTHGVSVG